MPRILLTADEPILAEGFRSVMSGLPDYELIVEPRPERLAARLAVTPCEVLLLRTASGVTIDLLARLQQQAPETAIVLWVGDGPSELALQAVRLGVKGVIGRTASPQTLASCVQAVVRGERWFDHFFRLHLLTAKEVRLTPRQSDLVRLVTQGLRNKEIAHELSLSEGTVKVYLSRLFEKLGVRGRFDLALQGLRNVGSVSSAPDRIDEPLSTRERQIVELLPDGLNNREIAQRLSLSEGTVKVYLSRVFKKVGVSDRYQLAVRSMSIQPGPEQAGQPATTPPRLPWIVMHTHGTSPRQAPVPAEQSLAG